LDTDNNAEVVATMTVSEICEAVTNDKSKLAEESESNYTSIEEKNLEAPPTNAQMQEALQILRRGVQHTATNFQRHYEYEQFIQELLIANKTTGNNTQVFKINFVVSCTSKTLYCNNKLS
jgi:hypothetical protein